MSFGTRHFSTVFRGQVACELATRPQENRFVVFAIPAIHLISNFASIPFLRRYLPSIIRRDISRKYSCEFVHLANFKKSSQCRFLSFFQRLLDSCFSEVDSFSVFEMDIKVRDGWVLIVDGKSQYSPNRLIAADAQFGIA